MSVWTRRAAARALCVVLPAALALLLAGTAQARVHSVRWLAGSGAGTPVTGFTLHVGTSPSVYNLEIDLGLPVPDAGGVYSRSADVPDGVTLYIALTAHDAGGAESDLSNERAIAPVIVLPPNAAPNGVIDSPSGTVSILEGESVIFAGTGSDPDGDAMTYNWDFEAVRSGVPSSNQQDPGEVTFDTDGTFFVRFHVTDSFGNVDPSPASVVVNVAAIGQGGNEPAMGVAAVYRAGLGLANPVFLTAPSGDPRLFVVERGGLVRIVEGGARRAQPFLDLRADVSLGRDGGLLGLAFDPDYASNGYFFSWRTSANGDTVISRFRVSSDPYLADRATELELLRVSQPFDGNSGGSVAFGPDGFLYVSLGDGGSSGDPGERAQDGGELLGKILRLDVGVPRAAGSIPAGPYSIPADNPFVGTASVRDEIWALGLRNPERISFDLGSGDLWIADRGQAVQELNRQSFGDGGRNYGWDVMDGTGCNLDDPAASPACGSGSLADPVFEYATSASDCAVLGGFVYRGALSDLRGQYFFGDACSGTIWSYDVGSGALANRTLQFSASVSGNVVAAGLGQGGTGELYLLARDGSVYKMRGEQPECSDGVDNDADGDADYPLDTGCASASSQSENPLCDDGLDNDGDGEVDTLDPECRAAHENVEAAAVALDILTEEPLCGLGAELVLLFPPLIWLQQRRRRRARRSGARA